MKQRTDYRIQSAPLVGQEIKMTDEDANGFSHGEISELMKVHESQFITKWPGRRVIRRVSPDLLTAIEHYHVHKVSAYSLVKVSLGPYHYCTHQQFRAMEEFKCLSLQFYTTESNDDTQMTSLYFRILQIIDQIRDCYSDVESTRTYDNQTLALIMLYDSCFILNFMEVITGKRRNNRPRLLSVAAANPYMVRDIMVQENQIPFCVLKMLMNTLYDNEAEIKQLLCNFYSWMLHADIQQMDIDTINPPLHVLEDYWRLITDSSHFRHHFDTAANSYSHRISINHGLHFNSATELKSKGIYFSPSPSCFLNDVMFESHLFYGILKLPTCYISNQTRVMFSNMIAYELSLDDGSDMTVLSYVHLMKSLIQTPADVKVLQTAGLLHRIGYPNHGEVVEFFKSIATIGTGNSRIYEHVIVKVREHSAKRANNWVAEMIHDYFMSPWKIIGLLAATLLVILTFLQTYYTLNPKK